ncbi:MAG: hypothetical protein AAGA66_02675 [Bacteroidota bacterium]
MKYQSLFSVQAFHKYYKAMGNEVFVFKIGGYTQQLIRQFGLLFNGSKSGFSVHYPERSIPLLENLKERTTFTFYMIPNDRLLCNYSLLNTTKRNACFLSNTSPASGTSGQLHLDQYVGSKDAVQLITDLDSLPYHGDDSIKVKDLRNEDVFEGAFGEFIADYQQWEELTYFTLTDSEGTATSYYLFNENPNPIAGIINVEIDPESEQTNLKQVLGKTYHINIDTRRVKLKYHIINRNKHDYDHFKLYYDKELLDTTEVEKAVTLSGEDSYLLKTDKEFALSDTYHEMIELEMVRNKGERNGKKRINLPRPEVDKIKVEVVEGKEQAYAEMYVYT